MRRLALLRSRALQTNEYPKAIPSFAYSSRHRSVRSSSHISGSPQLPSLMQYGRCVRRMKTMPPIVANARFIPRSLGPGLLSMHLGLKYIYICLSIGTSGCHPDRSTYRLLPRCRQCEYRNRDTTTRFNRYVSIERLSFAVVCFLLFQLSSRSRQPCVQS